MQSIEALKAEGDRLASQSPFAAIDPHYLVIEIAKEASKKHGREPHANVLVALCDVIYALMVAEGIIEPDIDWDRLYTSFSYQDQVRIRLDSRKHFFTEYEKHMEIWRRKVVAIFAGFLGYLNDHAFAKHEAGASFEVSLLDSASDLDDALDRLLLTYEDEDFVYPDLSHEIRQQLVENLLIASGIDPKTREAPSKRIVAPSSAKIESPQELVQKYLRATPYELFFKATVPFSIPERARFEHCHILGGTGHGKTQLLQHLILADIERAQFERRSIVVIDSQGDLIRKLSRLRIFSRNSDRSLYSRVCLIDPTDIEYPASLNIFDLDRARVDQYGPAEREKLLNGTIELYETFFGSLLGAELTQKQGVIFKYLARLMLEIPDANIHTLRDLMDDAEPFIPHMEKLRGSARYFFEREFFDRSFAPTKKQISKRLWGVLATPSFERMFAQPENKVDMFNLLNRGSIVLINTAKDLLKQEGCELFGRFFLSMISQAVMERSVVPESKRTPTTIYIDEAQEYFDSNIDLLLAQARKYAIGIVCANQTLDQLSPGLRASFMSNTGTKIVGGLSAKDANAFAADMHTSPEFLQFLKKRSAVSEFALHVRHHTPQALCIEVPLGFLEQQEMMSEEEFEELRDRNRSDFCQRFEDDDVSRTPFKISGMERAGPVTRSKVKPPAEPESESRPLSRAPAPEVPGSAEKAKASAVPRERTAELRPPRPLPMGRGGREHRYLQEMVKGLAEQEGYLARIEEEVADGGGYVDVSLSRDSERIACEIAITTPPEKEIENIRKCLAAGYKAVWVISPDPRHLSAIRACAKNEWPDFGAAGIAFLRPEDLPQQFAQRPTPTIQSTVRGYRVRVKKSDASFDETKTRRATVAEVLAKSLTQQET